VLRFCRCSTLSDNIELPAHYAAPSRRGRLLLEHAGIECRPVTTGDLARAKKTQTSHACYPQKEKSGVRRREPRHFTQRAPSCVPTRRWLLTAQLTKVDNRRRALAPGRFFCICIPKTSFGAACDNNAHDIRAFFRSRVGRDYFWLYLAAILWIGFAWACSSHSCIRKMWSDTSTSVSDTARSGLALSSQWAACTTLAKAAGLPFFPSTTSSFRSP